MGERGWKAFISAVCHRGIIAVLSKDRIQDQKKSIGTHAGGKKSTHLLKLFHALWTCSEADLIETVCKREGGGLFGGFSVWVYCLVKERVWMRIGEEMQWITEGPMPSWILLFSVHNLSCELLYFMRDCRSNSRLSNTEHHSIKLQM